MPQIVQSDFPTATDINEATRMLQALELGSQVSLRLAEQHFVLSPGLVSMLHELLMITANGDAVTIIPSDAELTVEQAAAYLNVSLQFVTQEASAGRILSHTVGPHRHFKFSSVLEYELQMQRRSLEARRALAEQDKNLDWTGDTDF
jgi:excisionase family DNA binding protein